MLITIFFLPIHLRSCQPQDFNLIKENLETFTNNTYVKDVVKQDDGDLDSQYRSIENFCARSTKQNLQFDSQNYNSLILPINYFIIYFSQKLKANNSNNSNKSNESDELNRLINCLVFIQEKMQECNAWN